MDYAIGGSQDYHFSEVHSFVGCEYSLQNPQPESQIRFTPSSGHWYVTDPDPGRIPGLNLKYKMDFTARNPTTCRSLAVSLPRKPCQCRDQPEARPHHGMEPLRQLGDFAWHPKVRSGLGAAVVPSGFSFTLHQGGRLLYMQLGGSCEWDMERGIFQTSFEVDSTRCVVVVHCTPTGSGNSDSTSERQSLAPQGQKTPRHVLL